MIEPTDREIGRAVIYRPHGEPERGIIYKITERFVFVLYDGNPTPKATRREDLTYENAP